MKRFLFGFSLVAIVILGCNLSTPTPQGVTPLPGVTDTKGGGHKPTKTATEPVSEPPTDTPAPTTNTTCNELSFYLDSSLASGAQCETIPEATSPTGFGTNPQYTKISLQNYVLSDRFFKPVISVFPVGAFTQLEPTMIPGEVTALQALIAGGTPGANELPFLPMQYARQLYTAQYAVLKFQSGNGIRFLTQYAQAYYPVNNHDMIYAYQGLTADGKYWISVILPISNPILPENGDNPPADLYTNPDPYYAKMSAALNSAQLKSFVPSIITVNGLVKSMMITP